MVTDREQAREKGATSDQCWMSQPSVWPNFGCDLRQKEQRITAPPPAEHAGALKLSREAVRKLGYYVYLYVDPFDDSVFYVGKGKGNRAFRHLEQRSESKKAARIADIRRRGKQPKIEILVHGLPDEDTALRIEAAVVDLLGLETLTNEIRGWRSGQYGRRDVHELDALYRRVPVEVREPAILIRIPRVYRYGMSPTELYDATRSAWRVGRRRERVRYAFAVNDGIILEVYAIRHWFGAGATFSTRDTPPRPDRWEFVGTLAEQRLRKRYVGKSVARYFERGAQYPFRYVNLD